LVDLLADPPGFTERLFESENVLGDAGRVPIEVLGRPGVWNAAAEFPEMGSQGWAWEAGARRLGVRRDVRSSSVIATLVRLL
jgi:hypothetical protein